MKKFSKGFTLVELLIVIAILGALAAMMTLSSTNATASADAAKILNDLRAVRTAAKMFYFDYPDLLGQKNAKEGDVAGWAEKDDGLEAKFSDALADYVDTTAGGNTDAYALKLFGTDKTAANASWYVCYTIPDGTSEIVKARLAGQASTYGLLAPEELKTNTALTKDISDPYTAEDGQAVIALKVR